MTPGISPEEHRTLLARFASGVTVATAVDAAGRPHGMTASAVCSVSLDPPMLLVCVHHTSDFHPVLSRVQWFALSVLAHDQESLSRRFAAELPDRFDGVGVLAGPHGLALIDGAAAHIICERTERIEAGDHTVFFGRVMAGKVFDRLPLLHFRGGYGTFAMIATPDPPPPPGSA